VRFAGGDDVDRDDILVECVQKSAYVSAYGTDDASQSCRFALPFRILKILFQCCESVPDNCIRDGDIRLAIRGGGS
jgi:hypothetical protein